MALDPVLLSRLQFAFVVSFHAIFPVFTIGLASYVAVLQGLYVATGNAVWDRLGYFWTKIFAVVFGMGVVSGIVMAFQFGTNWSNFSQFAANFIGPMLSYEVITAFFLEAGFLGVLLFGRHKVSPSVHFFAALMVAVGTFISAFWILSFNSWMQTPQGYEIREGVLHVTSWLEAMFTPSFPYRFAHMALAAFLTGGFVVCGVSAWFLLRRRDVEAHRRALSMTLWLLLILTPLQAWVGDEHGLNTLEHQPMKVAAMEGNWDTQPNVPLLLFALPDRDLQANRFEIGIPNGASLILRHDPNGVVPGLKEIPVEQQQPVWMVFFSFRVMVGLGLLMIAFAVAGLVLRRNDRLYTSRWYLRGLQGMSLAPFIAVLAGWFVTEIGRSPWLVYNVLSYEDAVTPSLSGWMVLLTLIGYVAVYAVIFVAGVYYLFKVIRQGLDELGPDEEIHDSDRPARPLSATHVPFDGSTASARS
ncbi:cytochrome ubiquinol oxidase subunit I [Salinicola rhizosphaerae]|uniref:Cytochrome ubiquinol oxidase subunit I n=1 Tax=Salinicola rhizosphaerae TaxID=1443141 RepID=A0ABQ3DW66_9GAMM|nr:cytochrome ubiquinol oxidase subunit I [Salinicola rhizosphaerae]GHB10126.1 cytochrome ubiquinol oxidase subunit I [Salinicola rhizosphaerae]